MNIFIWFDRARQDLKKLYIFKSFHASFFKITQVFKKCLRKKILHHFWITDILLFYAKNVWNFSKFMKFDITKFVKPLLFIPINRTFNELSFGIKLLYTLPSNNIISYGASSGLDTPIYIVIYCTSKINYWSRSSTIPLQRLFKWREINHELQSNSLIKNFL